MKTEGGTLVFIYGTLRKGCRAHSKMGDSILVCEATVKGKLVYIYVFQSEGSDEYNIDEGDWISFIKKYPQLNSFD